MFLFTGVTHFTSVKYDYLAMIPDPLPAGLRTIYLTGLFEIAGAVGLLIPVTRQITGICLILLLVAMFPANVNAALNEIAFRGRAATPLLLRAPLQLIYIVLLWWSSVRDPEGALRDAPTA